MPDTNPNDLIEGKSAFEALTAALEAVELVHANPRNMGLDVAGRRAQDLAQRIQENPDVRARFDAMPSEFFDPKHMDMLLLVGWAARYVHVQHFAQAATQDQYRIPLDLLTEAQDTKRAMMRVLDYVLADDMHVARHLDAIRQGSGYEDLANDLWQLHNLYIDHADRLKADALHYSADDGPRAKALADSISRHLSASQVSYWDVQRQRIWSLLREVYDEVVATGAYIYRHDPAKAAWFVPLRARR